MYIYFTFVVILILIICTGYFLLIHVYLVVFCCCFDIVLLWRSSLHVPNSFLEAAVLHKSAATSRLSSHVLEAVVSSPTQLGHTLIKPTRQSLPWRSALLGAVEFSCFNKFQFSYLISKAQNSLSSSVSYRYVVMAFKHFVNAELNIVYPRRIEPYLLDMVEAF